MFNLIRDNIPTLMAADGVYLDYAAVQNDSFFNTLLKSKLIEEVNAYLVADESVAFEALVDIKTVIDYLIGDQTEEFQKLYTQKILEHGGYDKKYIEIFSTSSSTHTGLDNTENCPAVENN